MFSLLLAWGVTEVIRYAFYATKELNCTPYFLTWLRYTTFIVLYPIGVSSELAMVWLALPIIRQQQLYAYPMPNPINMGFDYAVACIIISLLYAPGVHPSHTVPCIFACCT